MGQSASCAESYFKNKSRPYGEFPLLNQHAVCVEGLAIHAFIHKLEEGEDVLKFLRGEIIEAGVDLGVKFGMISGVAGIKWIELNP
jgi:hypothetical protein